MFLPFLDNLRKTGVPVSLREYLTFLEAMRAGLVTYDVEGFYYLARAAMVKDERHIDRFDRAFAEAFRGLESVSVAQVLEAMDLPADWLEKQAEKFLTPEEKAEIAALERRTGRDLADEGARWALRAEITGILKPWFAARPSAVVREIFDAAKLTWSEFRTVKEAVLGDPDLSVANPIFRDLVQEGLGRFPVPGHAADFSGLEREAPRAAPVLGAHTEEILSEVTGLDDGEIARLFDRGIVAAPNRCGRAEETVLSD